ncbi:hypothetical protein [Roseibium marinum]|uniref:Uncharacterized protein n=1 Tax=Roseibium marinum TaxID=281252 RepID=A0A2S3UVU4_9HYPH|nr:hypothetical protein [Roseibium marinum]POF31794.1 hypothetical protein CLV41_104365 [Roseibium marinum]
MANVTNQSPNGSGKSRTPSENQSMLEQFRQNLRVILDVSNIQPNGLPEQLYTYKDAVADLLGKTDFGWNDAYEAEKRLAHIRPAASLRFELDTQIASLQKVAPESFKLFTQMKTKLAEDFKDAKVEWEAPSAWSAPYVVALRNLLERVLNEVHWKYAQRYHSRKIKERYTTNVSKISGALLGAFLFVIYVVAQHGIAFTSYAGLETAFTAGLLGASFSILTGTHNYTAGTSIEDMLRETGFPSTLVRIIVGGIAAVMLYFFFETSLLDGAIIPELSKVGFTKTSFFDQPLNPDTSAKQWLVPNSDLCKLLVWSFTAGFSEKLVPSVLGQVRPAEKKG